MSGKEGLTATQAHAVAVQLEALADAQDYGAQHPDAPRRDHWRALGQIHLRQLAEWLEAPTGYWRLGTEFFHVVRDGVDPDKRCPPEYECPWCSTQTCPACGGPERLVKRVSQEEGFGLWACLDCPAVLFTYRRPADLETLAAELQAEREWQRRGSAR